MEKSVDVAIIGAGSAGLSALSEVRKQTESLVVIHDGPHGTTCARVGCMPSKLLLQVAELFYERHMFAARGIHGADRLTVNTREVMAYVRKWRDFFVEDVLTTVKALGDRLIPGRAEFLSPTRLKVGRQEIEAKRIILATGTRPILPPDWAPFQDRLLTTDSIFELEDLPSSVGVVGLGVIGVELGQALHRLGVKVVGVGRNPAIAGLSDPKIAAVAAAEIAKEFPLHLATPARIAVTEEDGLELRAGGKTWPADAILVSLGRRPNLDGIGLERLGVPVDDLGVPVFDRQTMQITGFPIFIAGDVHAQTPVLHEASDDGRIAGYNATRTEVTAFRRKVPLEVTFTDPQIAVAGQRFSELKEGEFEFGEVTFERQGRSRILGKNHGHLRIYADKRSYRVLGAELMAPAGEHLAHLIAWSIQSELTVHQMLQRPFYHPVVEEGLRTALRDLAKKLPPSSSPLELSLK